MLARLEALDGIVHAETDRAGDLLRLSLRDEMALVAANELLTSLGFGAEPHVDDDATRSGYDTRSVGELSRVEAGVIAGRIVAGLSDEHPLPPDDAARLHSAVADALHTCFITTALGAGPSSDPFRDDCRRATFAAAAPLVGDALARDLAHLLDADMRAIHRHTET